MAQTLFSNVDCWLKHMSLDEKTGLDQPGINLRAANGLEAVDYFVPGYAVWAKMVQALGDIGYDANNLVRKAPLASHAKLIQSKIILNLARLTETEGPSVHIIGGTDSESKFVYSKMSVIKS